MKHFSDRLAVSSKTEICCINLTILFYLLRSAIPFFKFPFILLYFILVIYTLMNYKGQIKSNLKEFIMNYYLLIILAIILIVSFVFLSDKYFLTIFKDVFNAVILLSLFFLARVFVKDKTDLKFYVSNLIILIVVFAVIVSLDSLVYLFDIRVREDYLFNNSITELPEYYLLEADYNIALLPVFFGFVGILYLLPGLKKRYVKVFLSLLLVFFTFQIFLEGSRRGLIVLLLIILIVAFSFVYAKINKNFPFRNLARESALYLLFLGIMSMTTFLFVYKVPYYYKNNFLNSIGSKNILITKYKITRRILRYTSVMPDPPAYRTVYNTLWSHVFNPEDPDSGWGSRIHKTVFPLTGKNAGIVPEGIKGYLMDSTCNPSYYKDSNSSESYTLIAEFNAKKGDAYKASVFCFVSDGFNADNVSLSVSASSINSKIVSGKTTAWYNLSNRGEWQKLDLEFECNDGYIPVFLSFIKYGVRDFRNIDGYVIFAYPQFSKIPDSRIYPDGQKRSFSYPNVLKISGIPRINTAGVLFSVDYDEDPIRAFFAKIVSTDTTYFPYKTKIVLPSSSVSIIRDRLLRWEFGLILFAREYSLDQKIFGGGFNFLNWYGYYFFKDKTVVDWPHNPFLSVLLYSGILGLLIYCFFLFKVFKYYIKYKNEYPILFIFFLITFFFAFFSGGSPFDPPIMGFFVILPIFIHSIHKRDTTTIREK